LAQGRLDRNLANQWVERLQAMAEKNPSRIVIVVADMARAEPTLSSFVRRGILPAPLAPESRFAFGARLA